MCIFSTVQLASFAHVGDKDRLNKPCVFCCIFYYLVFLFSHPSSLFLVGTFVLMLFSFLQNIRFIVVSFTLWLFEMGITFLYCKDLRAWTKENKRMKNKNCREAINLAVLWNNKMLAWNFMSGSMWTWCDAMRWCEIECKEGAINSNGFRHSPGTSKRCKL